MRVRVEERLQFHLIHSQALALQQPTTEPYMAAQAVAVRLAGQVTHQAAVPATRLVDMPVQRVEPEQ